METHEVYTLRVGSLPWLQNRVDKLNRRSVRLGCEPVHLIVGEEFDLPEMTNDSTGVTWTPRAVRVTLEGEAPKLNGWSLVAVKRLADTEALLLEVPGKRCPVEFRNTSLHCDHCNTERRRKDTFIVRHESGKLQQVGRSSLADFLGHQSPDAIARYAEVLHKLRVAICNADDEQEIMGRSREWLRVDAGYFVATAAVVMRRRGWVSRTAAREAFEPKMATGDVVWWLCTAARMDNEAREYIREHNIRVEDRDRTEAEAALAWGAGLSASEENGYRYNLGVVARQGTFDFRACGLLASLIPAYRRYLDEEARRERARAAGGGHIGDVGERLNIGKVKVAFVREFDGRYGTKHLVRMADESDRVLVWWASSEPEWATVGAEVSVKATIAKHDDFRGESQTTVKRVSLV